MGPVEPFENLIVQIIQFQETQLFLPPLMLRRTFLYMVM